MISDDETLHHLGAQGGDGPGRHSIGAFAHRQDPHAAGGVQLFAPHFQPICWSREITLGDQIWIHRSEGGPVSGEESRPKGPGGRRQGVTTLKASAASQPAGFPATPARRTILWANCSRCTSDSSASSMVVSVWLE